MNYRRLLIKLCTFLGGIYFFLQFVLPERIGGRADALHPDQFSGGFVFGAYHEQISYGFVLISSLAVGLGIINLLRVHGSRALLRRKGWTNSAVLILGLVLMLMATWNDWRSTSGIAKEAQRLSMLRDFALRIESEYRENVPQRKVWHERNQALALALAQELQRFEGDPGLPDRNAADPALRGFFAALEQVRTSLGMLELTPGVQPDFQANHRVAEALGGLAAARREVLDREYRTSARFKWYEFLTEGLFMPLGSAMFALLGFYIAAAAYRAFRILSAEAGLMILAAALVMLGQIPFGVWLWEGFPMLRLWILEVPNAAAARAIELGAGIAGLIMAFRMWFSIEEESADS